MLSTKQTLRYYCNFQVQRLDVRERMFVTGLKVHACFFALASNASRECVSCYLNFRFGWVVVRGAKPLGEYETVAFPKEKKFLIITSPVIRRTTQYIINTATSET